MPFGSRNCARALIAGCAFSRSSGGAAMAQKTIALTAVDGYPPRALQVRDVHQLPDPRSRQTVGEGQQLQDSLEQGLCGQIVKVRHVMTGMQKGLGDIGVVTSVFTRTRCRCRRSPTSRRRDGRSGASVPAPSTNSRSVPGHEERLAQIQSGAESGAAVEFLGDRHIPDVFPRSDRED